MKYLVLVLSISALLYSTLAVDISKQSTVDALKIKAKEVYKQLDTDRNGQLSYDELSAGLKKGLGFQPREEPGFFARLYDKYIASDHEKEQRKYFSQEDFEQIFNKFNKGYELTVGKLQQKASQVYDKFDANHDGQVTLEQLGAGLKAGVGLGEQKVEEKGITDYANQLYEKYVKADKVQNKFFTKQDFYKILEQIQNQSFVQQAKQKAKQIHASIDSNKDGNISMQEITEGIKSGLGIEGSISQKAKDLYDQYSKEGKEKLKEWGLSFEDISALVVSAYQSTRDKAIQIKDQVVENMQTEGTTLNKIKQTANNVKDKIIQQMDTTKQDSTINKLKQTATNIKDKVVENMQTQGTTLNKIKQTANSMKDKILQELDTEKQDSTINKLKQTATNIKDKVVEQLDTTRQNSTINIIKQTATQVGGKIKDKVIQEMDLQNENSTISMLKDAAVAAKDKVIQEMDTTKQDSTINKLKDTAAVVGAKVLEQLDLSKENSAINKVKDAAVVVKDKILEELDWENDQSTISLLRDKANELYNKIDKNSDASVTVDEIKEGIKSGLLLGQQKVEQAKDAVKGKAKQIKDKAGKIKDKAADKAGEIKDKVTDKAGEIKDQVEDKAEDLKDSAEQKTKQLNQKANQLYQKYVNFDKNEKNFISKEDFFRLFQDETKLRKQKQFLQSTKNKASEFYKSFDTDKDGSVSIQQLGAGIKQGLGLDKLNENEPNLFTKLYEKYVKGQQSDKKAFSEDDFLNYVRKRQVINRRNACKKADKLSFDELKAKAHQIHDKLDINDDDHISFEEISQAIKSKLGLESEHEQDENSFLNYLKNYQKEQDTQQQQGKVKISKDQFSQMLSSWYKNCPAKKGSFKAEQKQVNEQL